MNSDGSIEPSECRSATFEMLTTSLPPVTRRADIILAAFTFQYIHCVSFAYRPDFLFDPKDELAQHKDCTAKFFSEDGKWTAADIWIIVGYETANAAAAIIMLELNFS